MLSPDGCWKTTGLNFHWLHFLDRFKICHKIYGHDVFTFFKCHSPCFTFSYCPAEQNDRAAFFAAMRCFSVHISPTCPHSYTLDCSSHRIKSSVLSLSLRVYEQTENPWVGLKAAAKSLRALKFFLKKLFTSKTKKFRGFPPKCGEVQYRKIVRRPIAPPGELKPRKYYLNKL